jgi:MoxR-like ATPase
METTPEFDPEEEPSTNVSPTTFIGRAPILDTIKQHLLKGQHVCLYGDRGIGKTAITEEVVRWLRVEKPSLRVIHLADEMTFKIRLERLARELHELGLFNHPLIPPDEMATLKWSQISKRTHVLTLHELGAAVVTSMRGEGILLVMDSVNKVKPTDQAWMQDIIKNSVCLLATRDKDEKNIKALLARFEMVYVPPLAKGEAYAMMDAFLETHPVPSTDPKHYRKAV